MAEKLYLPVSILLSALILSATLFLVGGTISNNLTGLSVGVNAGSLGAGAGNGAGTANAAPSGNAGAGANAPPAQVNMAELINGSNKIFGTDSAKVKIVEFSDFECPFCGRVYPTIQALEQKYGVGKIAIYYRHFPLTSLHPNARPAALASECAAEQGKFVEFHDKLFANQTALSGANLKQYAADLGLDAAKFNQCFDSSKYAQKVDSDTSLGNKSGVSGTPTFFVNGALLVGAQPQSSFEQIIDPLLN